MRLEGNLGETAALAVAHSAGFEGYSRVTRRVGSIALTFVTFVIKGHCDLSADPIRCAADRVS